MQKRIISFFIAAIILISMLTIASNAAVTAFDVTEVYKSSIFYERLLATEITGDQRRDIVNIAKSQLGYHEGSSKKDFDGLNWNGNANYVEYNYANRSTYSNNNTYSYAWCASFVTWCARQAGVASSVIINSVSCDKFVSDFKSRSQYKTRGSGYVPIAGDLIFFLSENVSRQYASHIGIVVGVEGSTVYTIEGNTTRGLVNYRSYALNDTYIVGYAVPKYSGVKGDYSDFELHSGYAEPGFYTVSSSTLNLRASHTTSSSVVRTFTKGTVLKISEAVGDWGKVSYNGSEGWVSLKYVLLEIPKYCFINYDANGGESSPDVTKKTKGLDISVTMEIPRREGYDFIGWATRSDEEFPEYCSGDFYSGDEDVTLYAVWKPITVMIKFLDLNGDVIDVYEYKYGDEVSIPTDPPSFIAEGVKYIFIGWDREVISKAKTDKVYTAVYEAVEITENTENTENTDDFETSYTPEKDTSDESYKDDISESSDNGCAGALGANIFAMMFISAITAVLWSVKKKL